ncbi:uncharacterized protein LOC100821804 [Brachypodium distachyon]|uniref:Uncharacterized protein n=1 Tax=Brachypodium distachyon TaxID=15368 RepID=I1HQ60_BRADI|nr:uncharacterized protein LOC100821804 [Brachypodium distachyon]KQK09078.1 hypothetical protein BRADI_2g45910v3 [Brachypodium distachyon]|eukprot:XP_003566965.1 uncharacterized protein LOC100821804 [Brachypodium distachyon]
MGDGPDVAPAMDYDTATGARRRRGWLRRMMPLGHYSPMGLELHGEAAAPTVEMAQMPQAAAAAEGNKPHRRGLLRRLMSQEGVQRRWKNLGAGGASRMAALSRSLRWKRLSSGLSVGLKGGWATALVDTVAFRVMYVLEAIVLGLALSCFFCCCGCQI